MRDKTSKKISELSLIDYFKNNLNNNNSNVVKGIGDDAAVIRISKDKYLLNASDMLIEGRHFSRTTNLGAVGYKAMSCSISDIAAMGGAPSYALVSLGLPKRFKFKDVKLLLAGMKKSAKKFSVNIVGGDTNQSQKLIIDISMIGFTKPRNLTLRNTAKEGDYIFVTGSLGGSIYKKHLNFTPRVKEALYLTDRFNVSAMIDISDGLILDLWRVLKASKVGAVLFETLIPRSRQARSLNQVLYMGEDFELLFAVPSKEGKSLLEKVEKGVIKFPLSLIGKIIRDTEQIWLVDKDSNLKRLKPRGFLHF